MSTRGLIGFRYQDIDKLAYNHSDSGPDVVSQLVDILISESNKSSC